VGIFSIFKRKNERQDSFVAPVDTRLRAGEPSRLSPEADAERARQREVARATAAKIDAIEMAMANDIFNTPEPAWGSGPRRPRTSAQQAAEAEATLPMLELATTELLADEPAPDTAAQPQTAPVIEEIAILYANGEQKVAEMMLKDSLKDVGKTDRTVWWMLFDLYQASGRQDDFDNIAIDYASHFETSPPAWTPLLPPGAATSAYAGVAPTEAITGVLDAHIEAQLQRLLELAATGAVPRLEFGRVAEVTADGCALLHRALGALRALECDLVVAGADHLAELLRAAITIGQRDAPEAPWLLLLDLLQLLNREKDFEETAMDYCVTYEVSPPSFEAPSKVATAPSARSSATAERFMLPTVVEGGSGTLFGAIEAYAADAQIVLVDCSRLARIDYGAAAALQARLRALGGDKRIELRDLNHLVAALFKLLGYADVARLFPHKY
jgi:ABC-type transporter Mla MlaB component